MSMFLRSVAVGATLGCVLASAAVAQPLHLQPASMLVFPRFDSQEATATVINVTNTNTDTSVCPGNDNFDRGDVRLHYVYIGALERDLPDANWREADRFENLTPGDTISVLASDHNPEGEIGFLTVRAVSRDNGMHIDFDYLIGSAYIANSHLDIMSCYTPYAFEGFGRMTTDNCGHALLDPGDARCDGTPGGYSAFPDLVFVDSFFEEAANFENRLTLMSASGPDFTNLVDTLIWNNREEPFSRTLRFVCWTQLSISDISNIARDLDGDPDEFVRETGWVWINGRQVLDVAGRPVTEGPLYYGPALLGVFEQIVSSDFTAGHALHYTGTQPAILE